MSATYYFRVPVAGYSTSSGLPNGVSWFGQDILRLENYVNYLGSYVSGSWRQNADGNLQVSYTNGEICGREIRTSSTVVFACSKYANETISVVENPVCVCKCMDDVCVYARKHLTQIYIHQTLSQSLVRPYAKYVRYKLFINLLFN